MSREGFGVVLRVDLKSFVLISGGLKGGFRILEIVWVGNRETLICRIRLVI